MRKIIFINNLSFGGAERVVSRLLNNSKIRALAELWTLDDSDFYKLNMNNKIVLDKGSLISTAYYTLKILLALTDKDLVQAHLNKPILFSGVAKLMGANFSFQAVHCFSYSSFYSNKGVKGLLHKFLFEQVLKRVDFHIFKSKEMVDDFECFFGWRPKNHTVIYNPYDIENIFKLSNEPIVSFDMDKQKLNIAIVGRLNKSKRPYDIFALAKSTAYVAHYHFFGDGSLYNELVLEIEKRNIINITLHGMVSNPFKYIKDMGVYLSCSESEGFPNALIESMLCNAIPLHSDCKTGPKEILCDSYTDYTSYPSIFSIEKRGILFPVGDVNALEKAIVYISENYEDLKKGFTGESVDFLSTLNSELISEKYYRALMQGNK